MRSASKTDGRGPINRLVAEVCQFKLGADVSVGSLWIDPLSEEDATRNGILRTFSAEQLFVADTTTFGAVEWSVFVAAMRNEITQVMLVLQSDDVRVIGRAYANAAAIARERIGRAQSRDGVSRWFAKDGSVELTQMVSKGTHRLGVTFSATVPAAATTWLHYFRDLEKQAGLPLMRKSFSAQRAVAAQNPELSERERQTLLDTLAMVEREMFTETRAKENGVPAPSGDHVSATIPWSRVADAARELFNIWVGQPELRWAEMAWAHLAASGLARGDGRLDRLRAYVHLFVLASMYRDWCAITWDEIHDDEPASWFSNVTDVSAVHIGQLVGPEPNVGDYDVEDSVDEALNVLMEREREKVVAAVLKGFGGVEGLFLALWQSSEDAGRYADDDGVPQSPEGSDGDEDVLNNPTSERLAAYEWIRDGCQTRGPIRSTAEMDDWTG